MRHLPALWQEETGLVHPTVLGTSCHILPAGKPACACLKLLTTTTLEREPPRCLHHSGTQTTLAMEVPSLRNYISFPHSGDDRCAGVN